MALSNHHMGWERTVTLGCMGGVVWKKGLEHSIACLQVPQQVCNPMVSTGGLWSPMA